MNTQLLVYALGFIGFATILMIIIRNRYTPLIMCVTALIIVDGGLLLMMLRYSSVAGNQHLWKYIIGLIFIDVILMLAIWPYISGNTSDESSEVQGLNLIENKSGPLAFLVGGLLYASSLIETIITIKWFRFVLYLLFILWCIIGGLRSCKSFPDG